MAGGVEDQVHRMVTAQVQEKGGPEWTPQAKLALTKLLLNQAQLLGSDLEAFAKHGKRATVQPDDVRLAVRRNPSLVERLQTK